MDKSFLFKISSETDLNELIQIVHTAQRRINILKIMKLVPKAEIVIKPTEEIKILDEVPNEIQTETNIKTEEVQTHT